MKTTVTRIRHGEPIIISKWFKDLLASLPPITEKPLTKEQWEKLSPTVQQMVRQGKILLINPV